MIRGAVAEHLDHDPHFTWRGQSVTRIENLSDIVFALALGMLVSSSQPPQTFSDLGQFLFSIVPVSAGFVVLLKIWNDHFTFFRRFGLADGWVMAVNACLLFVVLYIAYPLRFAFDSLFAFALLIFGDASRTEAMGVGYPESGVIIAYFCAGFAVIHGFLALLNAHALRKKALLDLSITETVITRRSVVSDVMTMGLAVLAGILAVATSMNGFASVLLILNWPINAIIKRVMKLQA